LIAEVVRCGSISRMSVMDVLGFVETVAAYAVRTIVELCEKQQLL
jgi:hypothetical protein